MFMKGTAFSPLRRGKRRVALLSRILLPGRTPPCDGRRELQDLVNERRRIARRAGNKKTGAATCVAAPVLEHVVLAAEAAGAISSGGC